VKAELGKLIELQISDTAIRDMQTTINTAEQRRAEIEQEFEQRASSIREVQNRLETLKSEKASFEKQMSESKTLQERAERNLKQSMNQREYETAMKEVDACQKQIGTAETSIVETVEKIEAVEKEIEDRAEEISSFEQKRGEALSAFDAEVAESKSKLEGALSERGKVFATLPAQLASVYNRLVQRSRDGIAVAEVRGGSCSACFMTLRPQIQVEVRKGDEIITCESCTRILYVSAESTSA